MPLLQFPLLKEDINNWSTIDVVLLPNPQLATSAGRCSRSKKLKKLPQSPSLNSALRYDASRRSHSHAERQYVACEICRGAITSGLRAASEEDQKQVINLLHLFTRRLQFVVSIGIQEGQRKFGVVVHREQGRARYNIYRVAKDPSLTSYP